jgi:probable phosphoglycerate mutase
MNALTKSPQIGLVRHGATAWTSEGRYQGRADLPLSGQGFTELDRLVEIVRSRGVTKVVASPLLRARQSAAYLSQQAGLPAPRIDQNLIEIDYGNWEGLTQPEVKAKWPALLRQWKQAPQTVCFPGGESLADVSLRVRAALASCECGGRADVVILVTHAVWMKLAWIETGALTAPAFRQITLPTGSLFWVSQAGLTPEFGITDKEFTSCA